MRIIYFKFKEMIDKKLLKFIIVGIINTIFGSLLMFTLYNFGGFNYWEASATNYIFGSILSYFLNKYFTFKNNEKSIQQILKFIINILVCYLLAYGIAKPVVIHLLSKMTTNIQDNISMLIGMCLFTLLNYIGQRYFTFKE